MVCGIHSRHGAGGREAADGVLLKDQECLGGTERMIKPRVNLLCLLESMAYV